MGYVNMWRKDAVSEEAPDASGPEAGPGDRTGVGGRIDTEQTRAPQIDTAQSRALLADLNKSRQSAAPETVAAPNSRADRLPLADPGPAPAPARTQAQVPAQAQAPVEESDEPLHDPHELTVQMAAVGWRAAENPTLNGRLDDRDGSPVFVDESGRRSRWLRRLGVAIGVACAVYSVVIVATLVSGSSNAPWLPVPAQDGGVPASQVEPSSVPSQSAQPSDPADATPSADAAQDAATQPSTGDAVVTPGPTSGPSKSTASLLPEPSVRATHSTAGSAVTTPPAASSRPPAASPTVSASSTGGSNPSPTAVDVLGLGAPAGGPNPATPAS
ncbi:hypothetical protein [Streptomyces sp. NPDC002265]|uniref:hypothetical protein n=1 Tax=Streptomyces sp. NPDC002265 TaxID=3154415 RepID=UPI003324F451